MNALDGRRVTGAALTDLRKRVMTAVNNGLSVAAAARTFNIHPSTIFAWKARFRHDGWEGLIAKKRGSKGHPRLSPAQQSEIRRLIATATPDELGLPFALWSRRAVAMLIHQRMGVELAERTISDYLARWGFTPKKAQRRANRQDPLAVEHWLKVEFPAIQAEAQAEHATLLFGDETSARSDQTLDESRGFAPIGERVEAHVDGRRWTWSVLLVMGAMGLLRFMIHKGNVNAAVFIEFLGRLLRELPGKIWLIIDHAPSHIARAVTDWLADDKSSDRHRLRLIFLPKYSPELDPCELINHDLKANSFRDRTPASAEAFKSGLRRHLTATQHNRQKIINFYNHCYPPTDDPPSFLSLPP